MQRSGGGSRPPKKKKKKTFGEHLFDMQYGPTGTKRGALVRLYNLNRIIRDSKGNKTVRPVRPSTSRRTPK